MDLRKLIHRLIKSKSINSLFYYICVNLVYFRKIEPTAHYLEHHASQSPWHDVVEVILKTNNPRKKGNRYEIETPHCYILFEIKDKTLRVINAKRT